MGCHCPSDNGAATLGGIHLLRGWQPGGGVNGTLAVQMVFGDL